MKAFSWKQDQGFGSPVPAARLRRACAFAIPTNPLSNIRIHGLSGRSTLTRSKGYPTIHYGNSSIFCASFTARATGSTCESSSTPKEMIATLVVVRQWGHRIRLTSYSDPLPGRCMGCPPHRWTPLFCSETFNFLRRNADSLLSHKLLGCCQRGTWRATLTTHPLAGTFPGRVVLGPTGTLTWDM
jgi:hypothetical protein